MSCKIPKKREIIIKIYVLQKRTFLNRFHTTNSCVFALKKKRVKWKGNFEVDGLKFCLVELFIRSVSSTCNKSSFACVVNMHYRLSKNR